MSCRSESHEHNLIITGSCPACGERAVKPGLSPVAQEVVDALTKSGAIHMSSPQAVIDALTKHGGPVDEMTQRCRRIETRVTNLLRAIGMSPGCTIPDPKRGTAIHHDGAIHVSSPEVSLAEVAVAAVRANKNKAGVMPVMLCNQPWGHVYINGKE